MSSIFEVDSITKSFGNNNILTDVYLKCQTGDIIGLLGRNGSGKSTLLKILFGILDADHKFMRIDGKIHHSPYKSNGVISYLPQNSFLPKDLDIVQAVRLYLKDDVIECFFRDKVLNSLKGNKVSNMSGGELRYLEIKLLLNTQSKFVLLDEPFNGVSPILVDAIKMMILECSEVKGILLTDHDYQNVIDVSNRCCIIIDGVLKVVGGNDNLIEWGYLPCPNTAKNI